MIGLIRNKAKKIFINKNERLNRRISPPPEISLDSLLISGDVINVCEIANISIGGCFVEIQNNNNFTVGDICEIEMSFRDKTIKAKGVIRHTSGNGIGIEFVLISGDFKDVFYNQKKRR